MPTNRTRRRRAPEPEVSANVRAYLLTGDHDKGGFEVFRLWGSQERCKATWESVKAELLPEWIRLHPCSRPWAWWELDAPRWTRTFDAFWDGTLPEPRRRLGGIGTPDFEVLASVPHFDRGIPTRWVNQRDADYYNGRAMDIHGNKINQKWPPGSGTYQEGDFAGKAIDPADPPRFEAEAVYLERHGLLTATERKHLAAHPELLEPEVVHNDGGEQ
jgi:hypothetical protein